MKQDEIKVSTRLQVIYYQKDNYELGIAYASGEKRVTIEEAQEILKRRKIPYTEILKVKYDTMTIDLPISELENYTK